MHSVLDGAASDANVTSANVTSATPGWRVFPSSQGQHEGNGIPSALALPAAAVGMDGGGGRSPVQTQPTEEAASDPSAPHATTATTASAGRSRVHALPGPRSSMSARDSIRQSGVITRIYSSGNGSGGGATIDSGSHRSKGSSDVIQRRVIRSSPYLSHASRVGKLRHMPAIESEGGHTENENERGAGTGRRRRRHGRGHAAKGGPLAHEQSEFTSEQSETESSTVGDLPSLPVSESEGPGKGRLPEKGEDSTSADEESMSSTDKGELSDDDDEYEDSSTAESSSGSAHTHQDD